MENPKKIYLTGSTGFVSKNFISKFKSDYIFNTGRGWDVFDLTDEVVLHFAGRAHDLKKTLNPDDYYYVNTELTKKIFDAFLKSNAKVFITLSTVKAVADEIEGELTEQQHPNPVTHYGKSKLLAEQYIFSQSIPEDRKFYILRPCMIHGPGNKGNLNLLYNFVASGLPWPLGEFHNLRSYLSIENLCLIIKELIEREDIPSGVYNVADDESLSTNELIGLIAQSLNRKPKIWKFSRTFIKNLAIIGDKLNLPLNTERLQKLTHSYVVSNAKLVKALGKPLPVSSKDGLMKTFNSLNS